MLITTKLATFGSINFPDNFCQMIMVVLGTKIRKCLDFLCNAYFSNSCAQNRHDLLEKMSGSRWNQMLELCWYKHWALVKTYSWMIYIFFWKRVRTLFCLLDICFSSLKCNSNTQFFSFSKQNFRQSYQDQSSFWLEDKLLTIFDQITKSPLA